MPEVTMKAAVLEQFEKPLTLKEVPIPVPKDNEVLVKIQTCGVCHSDLHVQDGDWPATAPLPISPGHEGVGVVVQVGSGVEDLKVGDRVCTPWLHSACKNCEQCISGWETLCGKQKNTGFTVNGSFAEYCVAVADYVGRVPDALSNEQAAPICCAGVTVYKALKVSGLKSGEWMAIIGAGGGLGHLAVQYAKYMGMKVVGIDVKKTDFLKKLGCDGVVDASKGDVSDQVQKLVPGGVNGALCVVPHIPSMEEAIKYLKPRGVLTIVALPGIPISVQPFDLVAKGLIVKSSIVGNRNDLKEALAIAAEGGVVCHVKVRPFSEVNDIITDLRAGKVEGRVVMAM